LLRNARKSGIIPGWEREHFPENSGLGTSTPNGFGIFQAGEVEFLGKF